ncbi:MAG: hypothetical protein VYB77_06985 [Planctomycetota bacterium]|nr:hypothetical protein [Planctomycetota bacterium]
MLPLLAAGATAAASPQEAMDSGLAVPGELDRSQEAMGELAEAISPSLATYFIRATQSLATRPLLELQHVDVAFEFAKIATELDPDNADCWRLLLQTANISDPDSPEIKAAERRSLEAITRLDPSDEVMLLRRLLSTIEANQTAEEKVAAYETLLEPASIEVLGDALAARLAFSLAQLWSRIGDFNEFAVRLAQAVELDPHYPAATAMAAGYFAVPEDPFSEVELLVVALMANPLDLGFASRLGLISLEEGAYQSALRMLALAREIAPYLTMESLDNVLDHSIALWGCDRPAEALRLLDQFQRTLDSEAQRAALEDDDLIQREELESIRARTPPSMALLRAAILFEGDDRQAWRQYVGSVLTELVLMLDDDTGIEEEGAAELIPRILEAAVFAAWQGEDSDVIELMITEAEQRIELPESIRTRFEIWQDIVDGRYAIALDLIGKSDDPDPLLLLARSIAEERTGMMQDAARSWLELAREDPGSVIGVWSRNRLQELLGTKVGPFEDAQRIAELVKGIPTSIDRMLLDRGRAYSFRIEPVSPSVPPFAPIRYRLSITNNSGLPIAIGPLSTLRSSVALLPKVTAFGVPEQRQTPSVVQIDRLFAIQPRDTLRMEIDLANYPVGKQSFRYGFLSSTYELRGVTNFASNGSAVTPGRFGEKATAPLLRVDGVSNDAPWRRDAIRSAVAMDGLDSIHSLALLLQMAAEIPDDNEPMRPLRDSIFNLFIDYYPKLPPRVRAWLAATSPDYSLYTGYSDVQNLFYLDDSSVVVSAMLVKIVWGSTEELNAESYLENASRSIDPTVANLARQLRLIVAQDSAQRE